LFIDHFDIDGNLFARDRMPVRWINGIAQDGDIVLSDTGFATSTVRDLDIADVSVRTVFQLVDGATIGMGARYGPGRSDFGYLRIDSVDGSVDAGITSAGPDGLTDLANVEVPFDPRQEDIAMQLDIFSDIVQLWVWPADGTMPVEPLLEATASRLEPGSVRLFVGGEDRREPNPQDVGTGRFRYVHVADSHIPELSGDFDDSGMVGNDDLTLLLDGWGGAPGAGWSNNPPSTVGNDSLTLLLDDWGQPLQLGAVRVPEPSCLAIALLATMSGLALRCRD
jgi:hypothetical protein